MHVSVRHLKRELELALEELEDMDDDEQIALGVDHGNKGVEYLIGNPLNFEVEILRSRKTQEESHEFLLASIEN